jgi:pimeloyl-ACP methyl ester carboxylesterase
MEIAVEYKQNIVDINGRKLSYKIAGVGRPLLIIHGWGASSNSWMSLVEEMSGKGFQLIIPDLPGFGKSPDPDKAWGSEEYSKLIIALINHLGLKDFHLLGHSFGGGVALKIATGDNNVSKLILCDAAIVRKERLNARQKISKRIAKFGSLVPKSLPGYRFFEKLVYRLAGASDYYRANPVMKEVFKKVVNEDLSYLADKVRQPCLIIWGGDDEATPLVDGQFLNKEIKGSELKIIGGARHNPYKTHSKETAEIIINFLNK